jgi:peptidoglycan/xylan/chitin deacetylase (PgdA/CDA1 family)/GT2 family glycosyltransferase
MAEPERTTRFSVVIPTYQRRDIVVRMVAAFERQAFRDFELMVVVDGSTDGTADALGSLDVSFPLTVLEQRNQGSGQARNTGVAAGRGELLLFLDDDMEADPGLLLAHDRAHREGADLVLGDLPLHPDSPRNILTWAVGFWAESRRERLSAPAAEIRLDDLLSGQVSIARDAFERLGGFDVGFTRGGLFGGEDIDFGYRVMQAGLRVVFDSAAVSYQYYDVDPMQFLRRSREAGRAEQELLLKHPGEAQLARGPHWRTRRSRWLLGPLVAAPPAVSWPLRALVASLVRSGRHSARLRDLLFAARTLEHLRGARLVRRALPDRQVVVLAFHAIADLHADPALHAYGVPPARFAQHLDALARRGWTFIGLDGLLDTLAAVDDSRLRALLVTFDDGYTDLLHEACPILEQRDIPSVVFAVAGRLGATNTWDRHLGAGELRLLDSDGLQVVATRGVEVGSHGSSHRSLAEVTGQTLAAEVAGSAEELEAAGLPRPRAFSYPYGEWSVEAAKVVHDSGYAAAFTVRPGIVRPGQDRYVLPRIEVLARDSPLDLRLKIATARWPESPRKRLLRALVGVQALQAGLRSACAAAQGPRRSGR